MSFHLERRYNGVNTQITAGIAAFLKCTNAALVGLKGDIKNQSLPLRDATSCTILK